MRVKLRRFREGSFHTEEYSLEDVEGLTVLELLYRIREELDPSLSFRAMCRSSVCGTCTLKINGEHRLACNTRVEGEEILLEPPDVFPPLKDLVVSQDSIPERLRKAKVWVVPGDREAGPAEVGRITRPRDCILCGVCDSVCPPLIEGKAFGGPLLFTRFYSVFDDPRDGRGEERLGDILPFNVQSCVHCGNCNLFCPKGCMPERWITLTESRLLRGGYISRKEEDFGFLGF